MRRATIYEAIEQQQPLMQNKIRNQYNITHIHIHKIRTTDKTVVQCRIEHSLIHILFIFILVLFQIAFKIHTHQ